MATRRKATHGGRRPGSGRKPILCDPTRITLDLEREELAALNALARERGEPRALLLRKTIQRLVASAARRRGVKGTWSRRSDATIKAGRAARLVDGRSKRPVT